MLRGRAKLDDLIIFALAILAHLPRFPSQAVRQNVLIRACLKERGCSLSRGIPGDFARMSSVTTWMQEQSSSSMHLANMPNFCTTARPASGECVMQTHSTLDLPIEV